jgi:predicted component of type VI protein secretion system
MLLSARAATMDVRLVVEEGNRRKHVVHVRTATAEVGRARGCTVRIPSSDVSRRHCVLRLKDGFVTVEDLSSVNGTFLNGELVEGVAVVRPGDRLEVGPVTFVVEYDLTPAALERLMKEDYEVIADEADAQEVTDAEAIDDEEAGDEVPEADLIESDDADADVPTAAESDLFPMEAGPWRPPEGGDLRDLLSQLEHGEEEDSPQRHKGKHKGNPPRAGSKKPKKRPPPSDGD